MSLPCCHHSHRGGRILDWKHRRYNRLDRSLAPHIEYRGEDGSEQLRIVLRIGAPVDATETRIAQKQPIGGYRRDHATREANDDKSAVPREATYARLRYGPANRVDDNVDAALSCLSLNGLQSTACRIVESHVGALFCADSAPALASRRCNDAAAEALGNLNRGDTGATCSRMD